VSSRPRGRRPGRASSRDDILAAARARFAAHGYDRTRIRDVASDAAVDTALVHYFFGTKDGLFVAAMQLPFTPAEVLGPLVAEGVEGLGERMVRRLLFVWDENVDALLALVQGATSHPGAAVAVREFISREIIGRVESAVTADRAALRANLVASQIMGLLAARYIARVEPLASLPAEEVVPLVAPTVQRYLDGVL
jgi:AcrR family transcriptional regulator